MSWYTKLRKALTSRNESATIRNGRVRMYGDSPEAYSNLEIEYLQELITNVKKIADDRKGKLQEYTDMLNDGITLSAAELIAEDATQQDPDIRKTVWITSDNKEFEEEMNQFLQDNVDVETQAFAHAFNIVVYGECYLNTFKSDEEFKKVCVVGDYFEIEPTQNVAHIYRFGKPSGYYVQEEVKKRSSRRQYDDILPEADFIHFISDKGQNREQITIEIPDEKTGEVTDVTYTIRYGSSFLEAARTYYKTRMLLDDILLLSRLTRSQAYRLFGIEVGAADTNETTRIVNEVKAAVENRQSLDLNRNRLNTTPAPLSTGGNVFYATRNGKGTTDVKTIGGDVDVRAILDIDYFDSKYYGALKVPKQFLGQAEDMPGGLGDTTLTRLDIRYARTVKRVQKVLKVGYADLINWYWNEKHSTLPPKFEVHMYKVTTADDDEQAIATETNLKKIDKVLELIQTLNMQAELTPDKAQKLLNQIIREIMGDNELASIIIPEGETQEPLTEDNPEEPTEDINLGDIDLQELLGGEDT